MTADPLEFVRPEVRRLAGYTLERKPGLVKLDQNENPYDLPEPLKRELAEILIGQPWSRYPPFEPTDLVCDLARRDGVPAGCIQVGNGSNELLQALVTCILRPKDAVLIVEPTFALYRLLSERAGAAVHAVACAADFGYDLGGLARGIRSHAARLVFLCSPNNPTGAAIPVPRLLDLARAHPHTFFIIDEAYHAFNDLATVLPEAACQGNVAVLRTFSKAFGLAGLRVGYAVTHPLLSAELRKAKLPYNVNFLSVAAARLVLRREDEIRPVWDRIVAERERLRGSMQRLEGVTVVPSRANFLLFGAACLPARALFESLVAGGVLVRDVSRYPHLEGFLRVTVGTPEENELFLRALADAVAGGGGHEGKRAEDGRERGQ